MLVEAMMQGRIATFQSTGSSMWPLVQSNDVCTFAPVRAVSAEEGTHVFEKPQSEIVVGDIVICKVRPTMEIFAHLVLETKWENWLSEEKYYIGNIEDHRNGYCLLEDIYGVLVLVQAEYNGHRLPRPLPKTVFRPVLKLISQDRWSNAAKTICEPDWSSVPW